MPLKSYTFKLTNLVRFGLGLLALLVIVPSTYAFTDLTSFHPHHDSIHYLQEKGILEGYEDGSFKPNQTINRVEFLKMVIEANELEVENCLKDHVKIEDQKITFTDKEGNKKFFSDLKKVNTWYMKYVCSAYYLQIINGYPDGTFQPAREINFVESSKILSIGYQLNLLPEGGKWYDRYVKTLQNQKAIPGTVYAFNKPFTRSETSFSTHMLLEPKTASAKEAAGWTGNYQEIEKGGDRYVKVVNLKGDTLNVRKTNDPKSSEVGHLKEFDLVKAIDPPNGIIQKVQLLNGQIGYVHNTKFLKEGVEISEAAKQIEWFVEKEVGGHLVKKSSFQVASLNSDQKPPVKVVETIGPKRLYNTDIPPSNRCGNKIEWRFKDDQNRTVIFTYIEGHEGVHRVAPERVPLYELMGAPCSSAGAPISDYKLTGSHQSGDDSGYYQAFENARIYGFKGKDYMVSGAIFKEHENEGDDNARGTWSQYGFPTSDARKVGQKWIQDFEGGPIEVEAPDRIFKTSVPSVKVRKESKSNSDLIIEIPITKTELRVTGQAVTGEYIDDYKTDRWYPVEYDGKRGFVLATLLHMKMFGDIELDDNFNYTGLNRGSSKVTGIVLHATLGNNSATSDRAGLVNSGLGTQYYLDRDGNIAQSTPDYKKTHHAGYSGGWANVENDGSNFTIGIEISNWGPLVKGSELKNIEVAQDGVTERDENTYYTAVLWEQRKFNPVTQKNEPVLTSNGRYIRRRSIVDPSQVINIKNELNNIWKVWSHDKNIAWAGLGDGVNEKNELWQSYTDKQISSLKKLLKYIEERYGFPEDNFFQYGHSVQYQDLTDDQRKKYSHYHFPENSNDRIDYNKAVRDWIGIFQHHNMTGKFDAGPALNIDQLTNNP